MKLSDELAQKTHLSIQSWNKDKSSTQQALAYYQGEAYKLLEAENFSQADLLYAQEHLRIFSAFYGLLRPLDAIQTYRLDMNTQLTFENNDNLYTLWRKILSQYIEKEAQTQKFIVNLASEEFFSILDTSLISKPIIHVKFIQWHKNQLKSLSVYNKQARGSLARYILLNRITEIEGLKDFNENTYCFDSKLSKLDINQKDMLLVFKQKQSS